MFSYILLAFWLRTGHYKMENLGREGQHRITSIGRKPWKASTKSKSDPFWGGPHWPSTCVLDSLATAKFQTAGSGLAPTFTWAPKAAIKKWKT